MRSVLFAFIVVLIGPTLGAAEPDSWLLFSASPRAGEALLSEVPGPWESRLLFPSDPPSVRFIIPLDPTVSVPPWPSEYYTPAFAAYWYGRGAQPPPRSRVLDEMLINEFLNELRRR